MKCIIARIFSFRNGIFPAVIKTRGDEGSVSPLRFEKRLQFLSRVFPRFCPGPGRWRIGELEIVAEVAPILLHDPFRLGFTTVVIRSVIIKPAVAADVQIVSAEWTAIPPSHRRIALYLFLTGMTHAHNRVLSGRNTGVRIPHGKQYERKTSPDAVFLKAFGIASEI